MPPCRRYVIPSIMCIIFITFLAPTTTLRSAQAQLGEPLGEIVFASNRAGDFDIYVMNSEGGDVRQLTDDDALDTGPVWSPDGSQIAFLSGRDDRGDNFSLYVMDADGSNLRSLSTADIGVTDFIFDWSPDSSKIAFSFDPNYVFDSYTVTMEIFTVDVQTGDIIQITQNDVADADPKWSPDGTHIAFLSYFADETGFAQFPDLFVIDVASHNVQRLTEGSASDIYPTWSADGTEIMFTSYGSDGALLMLADMESGQMRPLSTLELGDNFDPQWSPDEMLILFESRYDDERGSELSLMDAAGQTYIVLAQNEQASFNADWSPDGSQIVYLSDAEEDSEIYIINTDGTGNKRLTDNDHSESSPDWRPTLLE